MISEQMAFWELSYLSIVSEFLIFYSVFRRINALTILSRLLPLRLHMFHSKLFGVIDDHRKVELLEVHVPHARLDRVLDCLYLLLMLKHAFVQVNWVDVSWVFLSLQEQWVNQSMHNSVYFSNIHFWDHVLSPKLLDVLVSVSSGISHSWSSFPYKLLRFI